MIAQPCPCCKRTGPRQEPLLRPEESPAAGSEEIREKSPKVFGEEQESCGRAETAHLLGGSAPTRDIPRDTIPAP